MATRGFEFAYYIDGSTGSPVIRDWPMVADTAGYLKGDLLILDSSGLADKAATSTDAVVFAVCQETDTGSVAGSALMKVAILTRNQVWRCSTNATAITNWVTGYTRAGTIVDENTINASGHTGGCMIMIETGTIAGDTNVVAYVSFNATNIAGQLS